MLKMYHNKTRRHNQNRKFVPILIITEAQTVPFFVSKWAGFVQQIFGDYAKMTLTRVIDYESRQVIW